MGHLLSPPNFSPIRLPSLEVESDEENGKRLLSATLGLAEQDTQGVVATPEEAFGRVAVLEAA